MPTDLQIAVTHLTAKKPPYDQKWNYYDGRQDLKYSSSKLKEIFHGLDANFTENWCAVVVDSVLDRLQLRDLTVPDDEAATKTLRALREQSGLVDDEDAIHESLCVVGEAFVLAWADEATGVQAFHNDARLCHAEYDSANPRRLRFAAKWWDESGVKRLNLYYPDRIEYYATKREFKQGEMPDERAFQPWGDEPAALNPFGVIPLFHFRSSQRKPVSQLDNVLPVQDMLNQLTAAMMVAAEFGAFPQRYVISESGIANLQNNPNAIWDLVAAGKDMQATQAGQFAATDLNNYLVALNKLAADIGIISRTPRHYFYAQGGDPSGEALIAMEAPLNRKVVRLQGAFSPAWRDLGAFLLLLAGEPMPSQRIWVNYEPPQTVQPMTDAQIVQTLAQAGMPLQTILRDRGWTDADLQEMADDERAAQVNRASYADAVLTQAQRQFDAGEAV